MGSEQEQSEIVRGADGLRPLLIALDDADPEPGLLSWAHSRAKETPVVPSCRPDEIRTALDDARAASFDLVIVDAARDRAAARAAIVSADVVFVPATMSPLDLVRALGTVEFAQRLGRRFAVIVNFYSGENVFEVENS